MQLTLAFDALVGCQHSIASGKRLRGSSMCGIFRAAKNLLGTNLAYRDVCH